MVPCAREVSALAGAGLSVARVMVHGHEEVPTGTPSGNLKGPGRFCPGPYCYMFDNFLNTGILSGQ